MTPLIKLKIMENPKSLAAKKWRYQWLRDGLDGESANCLNWIIGVAGGLKL